MKKINTSLYESNSVRIVLFEKGIKIKVIFFIDFVII